MEAEESSGILKEGYGSIGTDDAVVQVTIECYDPELKDREMSSSEEGKRETQENDKEERKPAGSICTSNWRMPGTYKMKTIIYQENVIEALSGVHACVFCGFILCDMKQHLLSRHKDEREVIEALTSPVPTAFEELILWGDHLHNDKVLKKKQGVLFVLEGYIKCRRPKNAKGPVDYMPCPDCLVYVFYTEFLSHRHRFCLLKKKGKGPSRWAIENNSGIRRNDLRHLVILMLSDLVTVLPKSDGLIAKYERSIMAAEKIKIPTQASSEDVNFAKLSRYCRVLDSEVHRKSFSPYKITIIFKLIKCLCAPSMQKERCTSHIFQMVASKLIHSLKACALHLKDKVKTEMDNVTLLHRVEKYLSLFDPTSKNISVQDFYQQISAPVQHVSTKELTEILPLTSGVLKLEDFLNSEMQKLYTNVISSPDFLGYVSLLEITAAKILLFNKPRAKELVMLTISSYKYTSGKLDPLNAIVDSLSGVEKKLCDRLFVVQRPGKDGVMVPILLTLKLKTALDLLLEVRSLQGIHSRSPYVFAKSNDENLNVDELLQKVTVRAELENSHFFLRMQKDKYIATACQIIAMVDNELHWLKSQIADYTGDVYTIQTSAMEMAKVVKHFCELDGEKTETGTYHTSEINLSGKETGVSRYRTYKKGYGPYQQIHRASCRKFRTSRKGTGTDQWNFIEVLSDVHACVFCDSMVCGMTEHLLQFHKHEREVVEALIKLPCTFEPLIRRGDHHHNVKVLQRQHGTLLVLKFRRDTKSLEDYMPCPDCLAYIFYAEFLSHRQDCKVLTEKGSEGDKKKADLDGAPQSKRVKRTLSAVEVSNIIKSNALRNFVVLMLSDAIAMLPISSRLITSYEDSMIAAERRSKPLEVRKEVQEIMKLVGHLKGSYSTCLKESFDPAKFHIVFRLMNCLYDYSRQEDTLQSGISLKQRLLVSELGHCLKACASLMKDKLGAEENQNALSCRVEKYLSLFDSMVNNTSVPTSPQKTVCGKFVRVSPSKSVRTTSVQASPQQIASPVQPEVSMPKTPEFHEILSLTNDILKLEKYLNLKMEGVLQKLTSKPTICQYVSLLEITLAKLILFNKPRAKEVVMLTVASYKDTSDKLDTPDDILQCLSSTERKLCERLVVVQVPNKEGVIVPILITPKVKTALDFLLDTRSLLKIHPFNPYLFAKNANEYVNVCEVLYAVTAYARLQNPHVLMSMCKERNVATICQILAMNGGELNWLKLHIEHPAVFGEDVHSITSSSFNMATVVELLCKDWKRTSEPHIADTSSSIVDELIPQSMDTSDLRSTVSTVGTSNMTEYADEPLEEKYSDVLRRANALDQQEDDESMIRITVDEEEQEEDDKSVVKMSVDLPNMMADAEEIPEEKYSEVLRRENTPIMSEYTEEQREEKYSDVLRQGREYNLPDTMEDVGELPEEKYSDVLRRRNVTKVEEHGEDLTEQKYSDVLRRENVTKVVEDREELPEEKYSDVLRRENITKVVEDGEDLTEEKYSDVLKRGGAFSH